MPDLSWLFSLASHFPLDGMDMRFMQQALVALVLLAPMTAALGVQVVHYRMAFFSDAVGHSAFAGVAIGLVLGVDPHLSMPLFGLAVGLLIMFMQRFSALPSDTVIGVVFSAVVAGGLAVVSRNNTIARDLQQFLYGDILTMTETDIVWLCGLFLLFVLFEFLAFNRLLYAGTSGIIARAHRVPVAFFEYLFSALLALVVMFSVWGVGVLLVTAMLTVPAASARNFARTAGGMFWWAIVVGTSSAVAGLALSVQPWMGTATGATIILVSCFWFLMSVVAASVRNERQF
ncbi:metal ABC transporter permease [uncultured Mailhella sp.]|uniref:metal ABC transporter permease n=1 Tax=uncultured Mailhella sp. TaxID=1981031 RepID=UPI0025CDE142|nr:metal ABC transporter permease [uncultured Mailhella sp.]